jgi:uncharacterized protein YhbP (UPF0306 family)
MHKDLAHITSFIEEHHVMSLATHAEEALSVCSLFYVYVAAAESFVVASALDTTHIEHIEKNSRVAGNILLESKKVGEIKGVQFQGEFRAVQDSSLKKEYFKKFPYALAMLPKLWQIKIDSFKMTDNALGFGKKLIWQAASD